MTTPLRPALACAEPHPLDPGLLCSRFSGHGGVHNSDDDSTWDDGWTRPATEETQQ